MDNIEEYLLNHIKINQNTECWEWTGKLTTQSYGFLYVDGKFKTAHRAMWEVCYGEIGNGLGILHKCDNTQCINPDHLFIGTPADNAKDMRLKGRNKASKTALTDKEKAEIRLIYYSNSHRYSLRRLAKMYGVWSTTIYRVVKDLRPVMMNAL